MVFCLVLDHKQCKAAVSLWCAVERPPHLQQISQSWLWLCLGIVRNFSVAHKAEPDDNGFSSHSAAGCNLAKSHLNPYLWRDVYKVILWVLGGCSTSSVNRESLQQSYWSYIFNHSSSKCPGNETLDVSVWIWLSKAHEILHIISFVKYFFLQKLWDLRVTVELMSPSNLSRKLCKMKTVRNTAVGVVWMRNWDILKFLKYICIIFFFFFNKVIIFHKEHFFSLK